MSSMNVVPYSGRTLRRTSRVQRGSRRSRIPKPLGLKTNGEYKLTRTATVRLTVGAAGAGWSIGGTNYEAVSIVFDPTGANIFGSAVNFVNVALTNASEISALWDRIRIDKVELTFNPRFQKADGIASGFNSNPQLIICNDPNDGATGTTNSAILQHADCKHFNTNDQFKWTVYPKFQRLLYYTPVLSSYEPASGFVNSDTAIPHYSTHIGLLDLAALSANTSLTISMKYFFSVRNVK